MVLFLGLHSLGVTNFPSLFRSFVKDPRDSEYTVSPHKWVKMVDSYEVVSYYAHVIGKKTCC